MILRRPSRRYRWTLSVVVSLIVVVPALLPQVGAPAGQDVLLHGLAGLMIASMYAVALDTGRSTILVLGAALGLAVAVGIGVEVLQAFVPTRTPAINDAIAHTGGAVIGVSGYRLGHRVIQWA